MWTIVLEEISFLIVIGILVGLTVYNHHRGCMPLRSSGSHSPVPSFVVVDHPLKRRMYGFLGPEAFLFSRTSWGPAGLETS